MTASERPFLLGGHCVHSARLIRHECTQSCRLFLVHVFLSQVILNIGGAILQGVEDISWYTAILEDISQFQQDVEGNLLFAFSFDSHRLKLDARERKNFFREKSHITAEGRGQAHAHCGHNCGGKVAV